MVGRAIDFAVAENRSIKLMSSGDPYRWRYANGYAYLRSNTGGRSGCTFQVAGPEGSSICRLILIRLTRFQLGSFECALAVSQVDFPIILKKKWSRYV